MVSIYDITEPCVIDEQLLRLAVQEQRPEGEAGKLVLIEGVPFNEVEILVLSFKNILKIENLWCFSNLVRLNLDNNLIDKIEGLDSLQNLKWLDLSFNNIHVIEGLEKLKLLEDLTLFSNQIRRLPNLDVLERLQVFSIGNNFLDDLDNIMILRSLKHLQSLNLQGNPLCNHENYKLYVAAFVPQVEFLDYRLIDGETRKASVEKFQMALETLTTRDKNARKQEEETAVEEKQNAFYKAAFVLELHEAALFYNMFASDETATLLNTLDGAERSYTEFREPFVIACNQLFEQGLRVHLSREKEANLFVASRQKAIQINKETETRLVDKFFDFKEEVLDRMKNYSPASNTSTKIVEEYDKSLVQLMSDCSDQLTQLRDKLMETEMHLADQIEDAIKELELNLNEMIGSFSEGVQTIATTMRDLEGQYTEQITDLCISYLDKVMKEEEVVGDSLKDLFVDKEVITNALSESHDWRTTKIDNQEGVMMSGTKNWMRNLMQRLNSEEVTRSRQRVLEINNFVDGQQEDLEEMDQYLPDDAVSDE